MIQKCFSYMRAANSEVTSKSDVKTPNWRQNAKITSFQRNWCLKFLKRWYIRKKMKKANLHTIIRHFLTSCRIFRLFHRKITLNITFRDLLQILKIWWTNSAFLPSYRHFSTIRKSYCGVFDVIFRRNVTHDVFQTIFFVF